MLEIIFIMLVSYILGSIPFGLLVTKLAKGVDIRDYGSGNIGATNAYRVLGLGGGLLVFLLDAGKGIAAVKLAQMFLGVNPVLYLAAGLCAIAGHN
jgi:glycerol-3-phosphate acyltransferase PlsY